MNRFPGELEAQGRSRQKHLGVLACKLMILCCHVELEEFPLNQLLKRKHSFKEHKNSGARLKEFEFKSCHLFAARAAYVTFLFLSFLFCEMGITGTSPGPQ